MGASLIGASFYVGPVAPLLLTLAAGCYMVAAAIKVSQLGLGYFKEHKRNKKLDIIEQALVNSSDKKTLNFRSLISNLENKINDICLSKKEKQTVKACLTKAKEKFKSYKLERACMEDKGLTKEKLDSAYTPNDKLAMLDKMDVVKIAQAISDSRETEGTATATPIRNEVSRSSSQNQGSSLSHPRASF